METLFSTDFGTLGIILVSFVMVFSVVAVPLVIWKLGQKGMAEAAQQERERTARQQP